MSNPAKRARQKERRAKRDYERDRIEASRAEAQRILDLMGRDRCFDLVRQQRGELLDAKLITPKEYAALVYSGSQGTRALETYDEIVVDRAQARELLRATLAAFSDSVEFDLPGEPGLFWTEKWKALKPRIESLLERKLVDDRAAE